MTFLLWNVQNKRLDGHVIRLVQQHRPDVVLLIEPPQSDDALLRQLKLFAPFERVASHDRFGVYVRFDGASMVRIMPVVENDRVDYWDIRLSKRNRVFLVVVHGPDMINNSEGKRSLFFERLAKNIAKLEASAQVGHKNTIVAGDFNANPFEAVIGGVRGLHAIRVTNVGGKKTRSVSNQEYEFFCNPMWACYKGWEKSPPGTYYFNGNDVHEVFWHMIDQVVLRPQALHMFSERNLRVLTEAGNVNLLTAHRHPDASNASDHLPVLFKMNLNAKVRNV